MLAARRIARPLFVDLAIPYAGGSGTSRAPSAIFRPNPDPAFRRSPAIWRARADCAPPRNRFVPSLRLTSLYPVSALSPEAVMPGTRCGAGLRAP